MLCVLLFVPVSAGAQVGEYRNVFSIGVNAGYTLASVGFSPKVTTKMYGGYTGGLSFRYTSEKYFTAICSLTAEINWVQTGWSENILTINSEPVVNAESGKAEFYNRRLTYVQLPVMAHLAWGTETKGFNFFFYAGPQFGYFISESTSTNFTTANANISDRANTITAQYDMPVEKKFDYGICAGLGVEYSRPSIGHFRLDARYYLGLANIYNATKSDYFNKSNQSMIVVKIAYLVDLTGRKDR